MFVFTKCEQMVLVDNTFLFDGSVKNSKESVDLLACVECLCILNTGYELQDVFKY